MIFSFVLILLSLFTTMFRLRVNIQLVRLETLNIGADFSFQGLRVEDLILEFGSIHYRNFKALTDIKSLAENSRYKAINIKIKRKSDIMVLPLTPRPWAGEGLLGCRVIPLETVER